MFIISFVYLTYLSIIAAYNFAGRAPGEVAFHAYMSASQCLGSHELLIFDKEVHVVLTHFKQ